VIQFESFVTLHGSMSRTFRTNNGKYIVTVDTTPVAPLPNQAMSKHPEAKAETAPKRNEKEVFLPKQKREKKPGAKKGPAAQTKDSDAASSSSDDQPLEDVMCPCTSGGPCEAWKRRVATPPQAHVPNDKKLPTKKG
jgi:hypothetical protein